MNSRRDPRQAVAAFRDALKNEGIGRRDLLRLGTGVAALSLLAGPAAAQDGTVSTSARIVIAGAGAAGLAAANRLARRLDGANITLIDPRREHWYQPGFTLVGAGLKPPSYTVSTTAEWVPEGATLIEAAVTAIDPEAKTVATSTGQTVAYDFLIVTTGCVLDFDSVEGFDCARIGQNGMAALYAGPEAASASAAAQADFVEKGGTALFFRPPTEMKCAGAPLKYAFLTEDRLRRAGTRDRSEIIYAAPQGNLFGVPSVAEKVRMLFGDRGIETRLGRTLTGIDIDRKEATFALKDGGTETIAYDFTNVIPPMRASDVVRNSPLPWRDGPWAADGWIEADKETLRHPRYPEVFSVGDVAGVPKGKTAASVKWQVPVVVDHIVADIANGTSDAAYNGYTSCPLITRIGRAMLVEFDYENNLVPSFPGVIAPLEELWVTWLMKEVALKPTYLAMIRGDA
jgi:sulfide:quinone oxidoreductase